MRIKLLRGYLMAAPVACALALALPSAAHAQAQTSGTRFGLEVADGNNSVGFGVGAFVKFHLADMSGHPITGRGSFDYFFPGNGGCDPAYCGSFHYWEASLDGLYDIANEKSTLKPYVGAGLTYWDWSYNYNTTDCVVGGFNYCPNASSSSVGLAVLGGINFMSNSKLMPFAELKYELRSGGELIIKGGIHIK